MQKLLPQGPHMSNLLLIFLNISMSHSSNILVLQSCTKFHKCFIIWIGVHGRSTFALRSLQGLNYKEEVDSGF